MDRKQGTGSRKGRIVGGEGREDGRAGSEVDQKETRKG